MTEELRTEIIKLLKENISISVSVERENDFGKEYTSIKVGIYFDSEEIASERDIISVIEQKRGSV